MIDQDSHRWAGARVACGAQNGAMGLLAAALAVGSIARHASAQIPCGYEVAAVIKGPFCSPFGYPTTIPSDIGEDGTVVGSYAECTIGPPVPFRWSPSEGFESLAVPFGYSAGGAQGIDDKTGWVAGSLKPQGLNVYTAAVWMGTQPIDLGTVPGGNYSQAAAACGGRVVGKWGNNVTGPLQAFLWQDGVMMDLGPDLGTLNGEARDVNGAGQVVGWLGQAPQIDASAFIWAAGKVTDLGPIPGGFTSEAWAISDNERVVGSGRWVDPRTETAYTRGFLWHEGRMTNLGTLDGFARSGAFDVNDGGIVVGRVWDGVGNSGFVWYDGLMFDLNGMVSPEDGVHIDIAHGINNDGQIVCEGTDANADVVGIVLEPIEMPQGDVTCDGVVSRADLLILLSAWGECPRAGECPADVDGNGMVNVVDLLIMLANWG